MAEGLGRKRKIRAGHKASATRILRHIDEMLAPEVEVDFSKLMRLKLSLQEKLDTIKKLDEEILELTDDEKVEEIQLADGYKEEVYSRMVRVEEKCASMSTPPAPVETGGSIDMSGSRSGTHTQRIKLPKLTLRAFNGDITTWTTFWDCFESAVHLNSELSEIDKFNYLKSLLERTAREAISGLTLTSANYHEAVSILKRRFGNRQQIIAKHMDVLLNIERVVSQYNLKGLRRMYDEIESHVRNLRSLGIIPESYGSLLISVILNKLPQELRLIVSMKTPDGEWNLDALMKEVQQEIEARERSDTRSTTGPAQGKRPYREQHTAATLFAGAAHSPCCYCQRDHASELCKTVPQVDTRKQTLLKSGRCFLCLRRGHIGRECRSCGRCTSCGGKHHVSICSKGSTVDHRTNHGSLPTSGEERSDPPQGRTPPNPEAQPFKPPTTTSLYVDSSKSVLLQTAQAVVYNPSTRQDSVRVRLLLDTGSQRSFITARTPDRDRAGAEGVCCDLWIGLQTSEVIRVGLKTKHGPDMELTLLVVPLICQPLTTQPFDVCIKEFDHLSHLKLADFSNGETAMEVDILIGSDYYWSLSTGRMIKGMNGPVAVDTVLGWVLSLQSTPSSVNLITTHTLRVDTLQLDTEALNDTLRSFGDLESLGIKADEQSAYEQFTASIQFLDGRYEVSLPWKDPHPVLPNNYNLCLRRLRGLLRRLRQDPDVFREYDSIIRDQIELGVVQVVDDPDVTESGKIHYLPHHAVMRKDKQTTKI